MDYSIEDKQEEYEIAKLAEDSFGRKNLKPCELEYLIEEIYPEPERESTTSKSLGYLL